MPQFIENPPHRPGRPFVAGSAWNARVASLGVHVATSLRRRICAAFGSTASLIDGPLSHDDPPLLAEIMANLAHGR